MQLYEWMGRTSLKSYAWGFLVCLLLTLAAYFSVTEQLFTGPTLQVIIGLFGLVQSWVLLAIYLEIGKESAPRWKLLVFLFGIMVTLIVVIGSLWIMHHLNYNMMP